MAGAALAAQVIRADLVHVQRNKIERRVMILAMPAVSVQETVDNMLGVRILEAKLSITLDIEDPIDVDFFIAELA